MRLLVVDHKTVWGGGQVMLLNLLDEWQRSGERIEPILVCPPDAALLPKAQERGIECIPLALGGIEKTRGVAWNLLQRAEPTRQLLQIMRRTQTDVVLANSAYSFLAAVFAAKLARLPVVWWEHNTTLPNDGMTRRMIGWADRIAVVSEQIGKQFAALDTKAERKITVVHNGVDAQTFQPAQQRRDEMRRALGWDESVAVAGTVGRLAPEKGMDTFVRAANEIARVNQHARFLIVGDGPERAALEHMSNGNAVRFVGMQNDVAAWLNAMDVFVLSSPAEAFPLAVMEAMACGLPVVAFDVGGLPEIVQDGVTGLLVPPKDAGALTLAVTELLDDAARRRAMGQAGRERVRENFLLEQMARTMWEVCASAARIADGGSKLGRWKG